MADARQARETRTDWQTARIVAMLAAVNSKHHRYEPVKYMANGKALARERQAERRGLTGEECLARFRAMGVKIIDNRSKRAN